MLCLVFLLFYMNDPAPESPPEKPFPFEKIAPGLYKIETDANSIIASLGSDGILLCDAGKESDAPRLEATVRELGFQYVDYIINTHWHSDHTGGNLHFGRKAIVIAHNNVRKRLSEDKVLKFWDEVHPAYPEYALPDATFSDRMTLYLNGENIEIIHLPGGHTDGDAVVYFRNANVLHVGDCLFSNGFPAIDFETGGSVEGFADNLERVASMMPADVKIVAGHGPDITISELNSCTTMIRSSLQIVREAMQAGMSLEAMQHNRILDRWNEYGNGYFTCEQWIAMIYESLSRLDTLEY